MGLFDANKLIGLSMEPLLANEIANADSFSGTVELDAGTAAAPSLAFAGDANTGIFSSAADTVNITTGGAARWSVNSSGQLVQAATSGGDVILNQTTQIRANTADAADNIRLRLSGGGAVENAARGAYLTLAGNEEATYPGSVLLNTGNSTGNMDLGVAGTGSLRVATNGTQRWLFNSSGHLLPVADSTYDIGTAALAAREMFADAFTVPSDEKLKSDIKPVRDSLSLIQKLNPVNFKYKSDDTQTRAGFVAQEVEKVLPDLISGDETKGLKLMDMIPYLVSAIKELSAEVAELKAAATA